MMKVLHILWVVLVIALIGCEPTATPFPADVAIVPTSTHDPSAPTSLRYALATNTKDLVIDLAMIQSSSQLEYLTELIAPGDMGSRYELVAAYGDLPGGTRSPITQQVSLVINAQAAIFTDVVVVEVIPRAIDTQALTAALNLDGAVAAPDNLPPAPSQTLRVELANSGWPDGIDLSMGYDAPGAETVVQQFQTSGIYARAVLLKADAVMTALIEKRIELALVVWTSAEERAQWTGQMGEANVIDLFSVPISYLAIPELQISFTAHGWPLATR